jgi:type IV pilus assembly protein PilC
MPQYHYRAARADGTIVEAHTDGISEGAVRSQLETQGLLVLHMDGEQSRSGLSKGIQFGTKLSLRDFLIFNQQFLALVKAGLPILRTFDILTERALNPHFQVSLQHVREGIRSGSAISEAMSGQQKYFADLYRATIQSGEHTGNLVDVLQRYIAYLKLIISVREKVSKALAYPAFLVFVGLGVVGFLLGYIMPIFAEVYEQRDRELPLPTQILLDVVGSIAVWGPWFLAGCIMAAIFFYAWLRTSTGQFQFHGILLRIPLLGSIMIKNQIIRLSRTLATILAGGIPLLTALTITANAMTNKVISQSLTDASARVRDGMGFAASLKQENFMPRMTLEMIEVGETTGSLETMLQEIAEFHESELDLQLNQLTTWIEPVLLLIMGFLVGGIVIVMYLPVFQLADTV